MICPNVMLLPLKVALLVNQMGLLYVCAPDVLMFAKDSTAPRRVKLLACNTLIAPDQLLLSLSKRMSASAPLLCADKVMALRDSATVSLACVI